MEKIVIEYCGLDGIAKLIEILKEKKITSLAIFHGNKSFERIDEQLKIKKALTEHVKKTTFIPVTIQNPTTSDVKNFVQKIGDIDFDCALAIGGGSVIDMAKLALFFSVPQNDLSAFLSSSLKKFRPCKKILAIPTTSGTGSEATCFATFYNDKKKFSLTSDEILPIAAIIDPRFTMELPPQGTACSGADALTQAIESFWSVNATEESKGHARAAIEHIFPSLENCVHAPDLDCRFQLLKGAYLAGKAINLSRTTACHSLSYPLTSFFNIPHGQAVSITLPTIFKMNALAPDNRITCGLGVEVHRDNMHTLCQLLGVSNADEAKERLTSLLQKIGLKTRLSELNVTKDFLASYLKYGLTPNRIGNNPIVLNDDDVTNIFESLL